MYAYNPTNDLLCFNDLIRRNSSWTRKSRRNLVKDVPEVCNSFSRVCRNRLIRNGFTVMVFKMLLKKTYSIKKHHRRVKAYCHNEW